MKILAFKGWKPQIKLESSSFFEPSKGVNHRSSKNPHHFLNLQRVVTTDQVDDNVIKIDENSNFQRVETTDQAGILINFDNDDAMMMMKKFPVKPVVCLKIRLFV